MGSFLDLKGADAVETWRGGGAMETLFFWVGAIFFVFQNFRQFFFLVLPFKTLFFTGKQAFFTKKIS